MSESNQVQACHIDSFYYLFYIERIFNFESNITGKQQCNRRQNTLQSENFVSYRGVFRIQSNI